ncbi:helix-turn-helix domain-containing protein [Paenarthrobacter ureafaciens]|uniref:helix-turn-helix domain-containing protein n=2 Tax=Paenarthrobacter TaxID=1742992 RepID=UPI003B8388EF
MTRAGFFPNAYKEGVGSRSRVRIPWSDVERYIRQQPKSGAGRSSLAGSSASRVTTSDGSPRGDATVTQVADYLQLHPGTIRIMARSGDFPRAYKAGTGKRNSPIRIPWSDVDRWRDKQPRANS